MSEKESTTEPTVPSATEAMLESLTRQLEEANRNTERMVENRDRLHTEVSVYTKAINKAKDYITTAVKDGDLEASDEVVTELAEIFGWELTQEVNVTFTITAEGTLTIPLGKSVDDLSSSDFSIDITLDWDRDREDWELEIDSTDIEFEEN
jgi:hypothetical protein